MKGSNSGIETFTQANFYWFFWCFFKLLVSNKVELKDEVHLKLFVQPKHPNGSHLLQNKIKCLQGSEAAQLTRG